MFELRGPLTTKRVLRSPVTNWDHLHYSCETATTLSEAVVHAVRSGVALGGESGGPILDGVSLPGESLRGADLRCRMLGADLRNADLSNAVLGDLTRANLRGANLSGASIGKLEDAWLDDANLFEARLRMVTTDPLMKGASLVGANVRGMTILDTELRWSDFTRCEGLEGLVVLDSMNGGVMKSFPSTDRLGPREQANQRAICQARGLSWGQQSA